MKLSTRFKILLPILGFLAMMFAPPVAQAQVDDANTVAIIKANYIFNFSKYSDWPKARKQGNFIVGVYGDRVVFEELVAKYSYKSIGSQPFQVVFYHNAMDIKQPHVLYVGKEHTGEIQNLSNRFKDQNTMVIAGGKKGLSQGAIIEFVPIDGIIRFKIDEANAEKNKIILGDKLKSWATPS